MTTAHAGWLYRQIHAWGANLMILVVFLHMLRTFLTGSFKKPRELTWVIGVVIFVLTLVFGFTGYLLPWNQLAYWATTVGTEIVGAVPWIGEFIKTHLRGGSSVGPVFHPSATTLISRAAAAGGRSAVSKRISCDSKLT